MSFFLQPIKEYAASKPFSDPLLLQGLLLKKNYIKIKKLNKKSVGQNGQYLCLNPFPVRLRNVCDLQPVYSPSSTNLCSIAFIFHHLLFCIILNCCSMFCWLDPAHWHPASVWTVLATPVSWCVRWVQTVKAALMWVTWQASLSDWSDTHLITMVSTFTNTLSLCACACLLRTPSCVQCRSVETLMWGVCVSVSGNSLCVSGAVA